MTSKEDLKMIKIKCHPNANPNPMIDEALNNIEKDLEQKEKQDKVLEIIKKKNVNIGLIKVLSEAKRYNQTYVIDNMLNVKWQLTEEEFNLLKKVLDNGK